MYKTKSQLALSRHVVRFRSNSVLWIITDLMVKCPRETATGRIKTP